jgi:hypothetical protein
MKIGIEQFGSVMEPPDDRDEFEANYVADLNEHTGKNYTVEEMKRLRNGESYGTPEEEMHYLNGRWDGWKARGRKQ